MILTHCVCNMVSCRILQTWTTFSCSGFFISVAKFKYWGHFHLAQVEYQGQTRYIKFLSLIRSFTSKKWKDSVTSNLVQIFKRARKWLTKSDTLLPCLTVWQEFVWAKWRYTVTSPHYGQMWLGIWAQEDHRDKTSLDLLHCSDSSVTKHVWFLLPLILYQSQTQGTWILSLFKQTALLNVINLWSQRQAKWVRMVINY